MHPCTASLRSFAHIETLRGSKSHERPLLRQDAAEMGPLWRGEGAQEKPEGWRAGCASVRCMHMDVHSANPVAPSRTRRAGCPESAPPGCVSFGDFSLHKQRKVTRSPAGRVEALHFEVRRKSWIPAFAGMTSKRVAGGSQHHPHPTLPLKGRAKTRRVAQQPPAYRCQRALSAHRCRRNDEPTPRRYTAQTRGVFRSEDANRIRSRTIHC